MTKTAKKILIEIAVLLAVFITDIASKYLVFYLFEDGGVTVIEGVFSIECARNFGASFGIFSGSKTLLIVLTFVECAVFVFVLLFRPNTPHMFRFSMLLILGGAIGNLFDRLVFGYVRAFICYDFLYTIFKIDFAIGNVADIYLVLGVFVLIMYIFFGYKEGDFSKSKGTLLRGGVNAD